MSNPYAYKLTDFDVFHEILNYAKSANLVIDRQVAFDCLKENKRFATSRAKRTQPYLPYKVLGTGGAVYRKIDVDEFVPLITGHLIKTGKAKPAKFKKYNRG